MTVVGTQYSDDQPGAVGSPTAQVGSSVVGTPIVDTTPIEPCPPSFPCRLDCEWIFDRVIVLPVTVGGTRAEWSLHPQFRESGPFTFQLQVGRTANPAADDWEDVGLPVTDTFFAVDDSQRVWAATQWTHYRVKLTTAETNYFSRPQAALGALSRYDWSAWKNHVRVQTLSLKKAPNGVEGFVLKRRLYGTPCTCIDAETGEVRKPDHEPCYGTGWVGGYFAPLGCQYADMELRMTRDQIDDAMRGMVNAVSVPAKMLAVPQLYELDVFVEKKTDVRYSVRGLQYAVAQRNVPVLLNVKLVPYPFSHVIYKFPISELLS